MKIAILYGSYSGGTQTVAEHIQENLSMNHEINLKSFGQITPSTIEKADFVIMGSPSWFEDGMDGQPHRDFIDFNQRHPDLIFSGKQFAIFGLGDDSYAEFCSAVKIMEKSVQKWQGELFTESLKINQYFMNTETNNGIVDEWISKIEKKLAQKT